MINILSLNMLEFSLFSLFKELLVVLLNLFLHLVASTEKVKGSHEEEQHGNQPHQVGLNGGSCCFVDSRLNVALFVQESIGCETGCA